MSNSCIQIHIRSIPNATHPNALWEIISAHFAVARPEDSFAEEVLAGSSHNGGHGCDELPHFPKEQKFLSNSLKKFLEITICLFLSLLRTQSEIILSNCHAEE